MGRKKEKRKWLVENGYKLKKFVLKFVRESNYVTKREEEEEKK